MSLSMRDMKLAQARRGGGSPIANFNSVSFSHCRERSEFIRINCAFFYPANRAFIVARARHEERIRTCSLGPVGRSGASKELPPFCPLRSRGACGRGLSYCANCDQSSPVDSRGRHVACTGKIPTSATLLGRGRSAGAGHEPADSVRWRKWSIASIASVSRLHSPQSACDRGYGDQARR